MHNIDPLLVSIAAVLIYLLVYNVLARKSKKIASTPPGPRPWPIIGNLLNMPHKNEWETFSKWAKIYGDIVYVNVAGRPMIILNTLEAATDLLLERSSIYSERPHFPLIDFIGQPKFNFGFMAYGKEWKEHRKTFMSGYRQGQLSTYYNAHYFSTKVALRNFRDDPTNYKKHFKLHAGQAIIHATYGLEVHSFGDPLIKIAERVMDDVAVALRPVMWIMNPIPLLEKLPRWFGGNYLTSLSDRCKEHVEDLQHIPFEMTKAAIASGNYNDSFISTRLREIEHVPIEERQKAEDVLRSISAVAYGAASDTTVAGEEIFLLAMILHPASQERAQREIDSVVDSDRLPTFDDRSQLPYISAIVKEVLRWHCPVPEGIPHMLNQDDHYKGYLLPAGSMVVGNIWNILHDPQIFENPLQFLPERFLSPNRMDGQNGMESQSKVELAWRVTFGFGRRSCPGLFFAQDALWLIIAQFLAVYNVSVDPKSPSPKAEFTSGSLSHPIPFKYRIEIRSQNRAALLD